MLARPPSDSANIATARPYLVFLYRGADGDLGLSRTVATMPHVRRCTASKERPLAPTSVPTPPTSSWAGVEWAVVTSTGMLQARCYAGCSELFVVRREELCNREFGSSAPAAARVESLCSAAIPPLAGRSISRGRRGRRSRGQAPSGGRAAA